MQVDVVKLKWVLLEKISNGKAEKSAKRMLESGLDNEYIFILSGKLKLYCQHNFH